MTVTSTNRYGSLDEAVRSVFGNERRTDKRQYTSGGDINEACILTLDDGQTVFMKYNEAGFLPGYEAEAEGLRAIKKSGCIGTPKVLALGTDGGKSFLLLEHIQGGAAVKNYWEVFGCELAAMHKAPPEYAIGFGYPRDNFIGKRKQINTPSSGWISFYRDCRLKPQLQAADRYFGHRERKAAEYLLSNLDRYLAEPKKPSLLHGDLWAGNRITGNDGKAWVIDPAVYYGHPEADLAMTQLFGGFPGVFYEAYKETGMYDPGYPDRRDLYHLYQLLNHLNMFGGSYLYSVREILCRYGG